MTALFNLLYLPDILNTTFHIIYYNDEQKIIKIAHFSKFHLTSGRADFIIDKHCIGVWRSLVSRMVRDHEAAGSSPATPTK